MHRGHQGAGALCQNRPEAGGAAAEPPAPTGMLPAPAAERATQAAAAAEEPREPEGGGEEGGVEGGEEGPMDVATALQIVTQHYRSR